jgi:hypothetical protein
VKITSGVVLYIVWKSGTGMPALHGHIQEYFLEFMLMLSLVIIIYLLFFFSSQQMMMCLEIQE